MPRKATSKPVPDTQRCVQCDRRACLGDIYCPRCRGEYERRNIALGSRETVDGEPARGLPIVTEHGQTLNLQNSA